LLPELALGGARYIVQCDLNERDKVPYKNPEDAKAWRLANPEKVKAIQDKYIRTHPEKARERGRRYRLANLEKRREGVRQWRKKHKNYGREWKQKNPDKLCATKAKRRAKVEGNGGSFTAEQWRFLCTKCSNRCLCCGKRRKLTADHVIPVSKGGTSNIENIQPLCGPCNSRKGTKATDYRNGDAHPSPQPEGPAMSRGRKQHHVVIHHVTF
jgi:5-methylcytosine-specific restriction endonuclease McrA